MRFSFADRQPSTARTPHLRGRGAALLLAASLTGCASNGEADRPADTDMRPPAVEASKCAPPESTVSPDVDGIPFETQRAAFVAALGAHETRTDFRKETSPQDTSSGAYGYMATTWNDHEGYDEAYLAPPAVQYDRAVTDATQLYSRSEDWGDVAVFWIGGPDALTQPDILCNNTGPSYSEYSTDVITQMNEYLTDPEQIPAVPGLPEAVYNPAASTR